MQFVVHAEHAPELCPTSNAKIRNIMKQGAKGLPDLARKLGVKIITTNVYGPDHVILMVVEAADIEAVRNLVWESGMIQWNTTRIHATMSLEDAMAKADKLPAIF